MTTRVWAVAQFDALEQAVARGALLPCKTDYNRDSLFGYAFGFELQKRTLCSMSAKELQYEGTEDTTWEEFASRWAPGVPTGVTHFTDDDGKEKVICSLRFHFIDGSKKLPNMLQDLPPLWRGYAEGNCSVCNLVVEDKGAVCRGCNNRVHVSTAVGPCLASAR